MFLGLPLVVKQSFSCDYNENKVGPLLGDTYKQARTYFLEGYQHPEDKFISYLILIKCGSRSSKVLDIAFADSMHHHRGRARVCRT